MGKLQKILQQLSLGAGYAASLSVVALCLLVLSEILLRALWHSSTLIADEYSGYFYLASVFLGLGYVFSQQGHIQITLLSTRVSGKAKKFLNFSLALILFLLLSFLFYRSLILVYNSYDLEMVSTGVSQTAIYKTQLAMPIGILFFLLAVAAYMLKLGMTWRQKP